MDLGGELVWDAPLTAYPDSSVVAPNLAVHDRVVAVRQRVRLERSSIAIEAFDLTDGQKRWDTKVQNVNGISTEAFAIRTPSELFEVLEPDVVIARDPTTGHERHRTVVDRGLRRFTPFGDRLVVDGDNDGMIIERGGSLVLGLGMAGCVAQNTYFGVHFDSEAGYSLVALGQADREVRRVADFSAQDRVPVACFSYRNELAIVTTGDSKLPTRIQFLAMNGRFLKAIDLPKTAKQGALRFLGDPLPSSRFVPVVTRDGDDEILSLLDLERRRMVWTRSVDADLEVFRAGANWYVIGKHERLSIATIDGDTGQLRGAIELDGPVQRVGPHSVGGGSLWLVPTGSWSSRLAAVRLDATSLTVTLESSALPIRDARDTFLNNLPSPN